MRLVQLGSSHQALTVTQKLSEVKPQNYEFHTTGCPKSGPVPARMITGPATLARKQNFKMKQIITRLEPREDKPHS